jgi:nucleoside-diphosphate-sugar epimerase
MSETRVAVTGVGGFIGLHLTRRLLTEGYRVRGILGRTCKISLPDPVDVLQVGRIDGSTDWSRALAGVDAIVHLAARTHVLHERRGGDLADYRSVNVDGTRRLAEMAAVAGVSRLIFLSSVKVNGERTSTRPFASEDPPAPKDAYGVSKWEAEQLLAEIAARSGMEAVIIRPPLVYGSGSKGNFARLCHAVARGWVLPLAAVNNRRSLVGVQNLVDLIVRCVCHKAARGGTFMVSDGEDLSTPDLIRRIARASGTEARLVAVPPDLLRLAGWVTGKSLEIERLTGSLQVDIEETRRTLGWEPPVTVERGLASAVSVV